MNAAKSVLIVLALMREALCSDAIRQTAAFLNPYEDHSIVTMDQDPVFEIFHRLEHFSDLEEIFVALRKSDAHEREGLLMELQEQAEFELDDLRIQTKRAQANLAVQIEPLSLKVSRCKIVTEKILAREHTFLPPLCSAASMRSVVAFIHFLDERGLDLNCNIASQHEVDELQATVAAIHDRATSQYGAIIDTISENSEDEEALTELIALLAARPRL